MGQQVGKQLSLVPHFQDALIKVILISGNELKFHRLNIAMMAALFLPCLRSLLSDPHSQGHCQGMLTDLALPGIGTLAKTY